MNLSLIYTKNLTSNTNIKITGSKSESNRLLLLKALFPNLDVKNVSNSDDSQLMQKALEGNKDIVDIHHAGTAMRFLTAYFATQTTAQEITLTGSERMQQRPIGILVDALQQLGCQINYAKEEGFPPLKIKGASITRNKVNIQANVSSQYISALLLVGSKLENGITLKLEGEITSTPYIKMTLSLLKEIGIESEFNGNQIKIIPQKEVKDQSITVESDWSSVSYFYSLVALSEIGFYVTIGSYKKESYQGDSCLAEIYEKLGVKTTYHNDQITLSKIDQKLPKTLELDLINAPDIAQTIAVSCFGLGIACDLQGLHTLKIKETDRLVALQNEIQKFGGKVNITDKSLHLETFDKAYQNDVSIETYHDHRMAMAFAPLALRVGFTILEADVVSKSYPDFWNDMKNIGLQF